MKLSSLLLAAVSAKHCNPTIPTGGNAAPADVDPQPVTDARYGCTNENGTYGPHEKCGFFYQCDPNSGRKWVMPASRGLYWDVVIGGQNWINSISYDNDRNPQCERGAEPWQNANNLDQAKCECIDCDEADTTAACARL